MTAYIVAVVILLVLLIAPWAIWYISPYEREFRLRRQHREELRKSREARTRVYIDRNGR